MTSRELLQQWLNGIHIAQVAHLRCAARYQANHRRLGVPVIFLTTVVGTSIFATLESAENQIILITAGIVSALAAILSGLQTFLNYSELAARHAEAGKRFGKLRKRVEELLVTPCSNEDLAAHVATIRTEWDQLEDEAPTVPQAHHDRATRRVLGQHGHGATQHG
jgi:conflict system pore-forming effector with SLATT domain